MTEYIERAMMGRPNAWTTWGAFRDKIDLIDWSALFIVLATLMATFLGGCASRLHVTSERVWVEIPNRTEQRITCHGELKGLTSTGYTVSREFDMRVKPGKTNVRSLWANPDHPFIDAWREVKCEPQSSFGIEYGRIPLEG